MESVPAGTAPSSAAGRTVKPTKLEDQWARPPSRLWVWWIGARPKTLLAAIAPVLVGTAMAVEAGAFHGAAALCALLGALLIQIGTNYANDYQDFLKGADSDTRQGPLRITQAGLASPEHVRRAAIVAFLLAVAAGAYLIYRGGWPIVIIGVLAIVFGALYTGGRYSLAYLGLADPFVLIFFGPVAVAGTFYVQAVSAATLPAVLPLAIVAGLGVGALAVAILLANNIRDVGEDAAAGKRTLVVRIGRRAGEAMYLGCFLVAAAVPVALWTWTGAYAFSIAASFVVLPLGITNFRDLRDASSGSEAVRVLERTALALLLFSVLFSGGWLVG